MAQVDFNGTPVFIPTKPPGVLDIPPEELTPPSAESCLADEQNTDQQTRASKATDQ